MKISMIILTLIFSLNISAQINNEHLEVGDVAPQIIGIDQNGKEINSIEILKYNKILMVFYRGNWCPHCKKHLGSLEEHLNEFTKKGVFVMVVTPESEDRTKETAEKWKTNFSIIHDVENKIMNAYKVAFEVNEENVPNYYGYVTNKVTTYNVENNNVLPVPATYIIDQNGKISYVQYDPDYKNRSDFSEIIKSL
ncbi:MAG: redoxin domain-containing protein [Flavobacteriaceae bacterium]|nr:redoxin domain-containing protein [Flavobacteriaceae bacterium]